MYGYNICGIYEIAGRILRGTTVVAYVVKDRRDGRTFTMEKQAVEQLALNKQIYNCSAQVYEGIVNLKGINCKLNKLPKYDEQGNIVKSQAELNSKQSRADLVVVGKVQRGKEVLGYIVQSREEPSKKVELTKENVAKLAKAGRVLNVKSQNSGGQVILRGENGFSLANVAVYSAR